MFKSTFFCFYKKFILVITISFLVSSCGVKINTARQHVSGSLLVSEKNNGDAISIAEVNKLAMD